MNARSGLQGWRPEGPPYAAPSSAPTCGSAVRPAGAVMAARHSAPDALDFFPTPPWATRALVRCVLNPRVIEGESVWEPACGEGHMAEVLRTEGFSEVFASDVHDYGVGYAVGSFVGEGLDVIEAPFEPHWIITNPPFNLACAFAERALTAAPSVALLVRSAWLEGCERFTRLFAHKPPQVIAQFCERVPMIKGRWDPKASTATAYAWVIWSRPRRSIGQVGTAFCWIPPGQRQRLTLATDYERFAAAAP